MPDVPPVHWTQPAPHRRPNLRLALLALIPILGLIGRSAYPAQAQDARCFADQAPEISACISGPFRTFWEQHGGLDVFGYPLSDAATRTTAEGTFMTQYFQRARFELHPEHEPPYDVLLGRLGAERLEALGRNWTEGESEDEISACQFWAQTGHNVCGPFLRAWRSTGLQLDDDPALSDAERLALWGLPLTGQVPVTTDAGVVLTQWFERARFEQQPDGTMTFGLLGNEAVNAPNVVSPPAPAESAPPAESSPPSEATSPAESPLPSEAASPVESAPPPEAASPSDVASPAEAVPSAEPTAVAAAEPAPVPSVPFPSIPCNVNVPTPAEGLQVWMADPRPPRGTDAVACVRLIVGGEAANGANAMVYRIIGKERRPSIPQSTGLSGVASFIFYIGEERSGRRIPVEAVVNFRGVTYTARTEFVPQ